MEKREFTLSTGKKVEMAEMDLGQFIEAQDLVGNIANEAKMAFVLAVCSLKSIDGSPVLPLSNATAFKGVAGRFSVTEGFELCGFYAQLNPAPTGDSLKNE